MRLLLSSLAAMAALSVGVSGQCVVKTTSVPAGATLCTTVSSGQVELIGGSAPNIAIPKFDTTQFGAQTPILDAVWINFIDADYNPFATYQATIADTNDFTVSLSIPATWTLLSLVDSKTFSIPQMNTAVNQGGLSVEPTAADNAVSCVDNVDSFGGHTECLLGGIVSKDFKMTDNTFDGPAQTLTVASGAQTFKPRFSLAQTYVEFQGPTTNTATSGLRVTTTTPAAGYKNAGPGQTWILTTGSSTSLTTPSAVGGTQSTNIKGSGGVVTVSSAHSLKLTLEVQYDYHFASVGGDPQFAGFQGQNFQVHGAPESYFALISAPQYYVNARFDYLSTGKCDYNETQCFTHPGTYMGMVYVGMKDAGILIQSGPHASGFAAVLINDKPMQVGERFAMNGLSANSYVHMISPSKLHLVLDTIDLTITNSDLFVNFDLGLTDKQLLQQGATRHVIPNGATPSQVAHNLNKWYGSFNPLHGLIGQTWRNVKYNDGKLYQGDVTEYQLDKIVDHTFLYCVYEP